MSMLGLAMPYGEEVVIGEIVDGERQVYRETFDDKSWAPLPKRVPFLRSHLRAQSPLGWTTVANRAGGLHVLIDPIAGSTAANDATAEVRSGVVKGLSVGFWPDPDHDEIDAKDRRRLPLVRRRGAVLREVSLALQGAYPSAKITSVDADADAHAESEKLLEPMRRAMEIDAADRRRSDAELLAWLDRETAPKVAEKLVVTSTDPERKPLARIAGQTFEVVAGQDAAYATDQYMRLVVERITRSGRGLFSDELAELRERCGLVAL